MLRFFHRLKVSQKLMLISVLFMIPDSVLLCLFLISINANIEFAQWEQYGNEYQRPLEELLEHLPNHLALSRQSTDKPGAQLVELANLQARIDQALAKLESVDAQLGAKLQFTDEGLAKRKREHCRVRNVRLEWQKLKSDLLTLKPAECAEQHLHLIADVRTMITHVGDSSNLILDPDLDSYYLMDVTLLALPQMQDRLASVMAFGKSALTDQVIRSDEQRQLAVYAALLKEADLDRVVSSTQTALNEDENFYGTSESLHRRIPPLLKEFSDAAEKFARLTASLSESEHATLKSDDFVAAGLKARQASFTLWQAADQELDVLLAKRIHYYRMRRARSLLLTGLALMAAVSFVAFITNSISRPLQKQAAQLLESNQALQTEVNERQRVEVALRAAEEKYRGIFENSVEGIFRTTPDGRYLVANPTLARMYGYETVSELQEGMTDIGGRLYVDPACRTEFQRRIEQFGLVQNFEAQVYRKDQSVIWISENARAVRDPSGALLYYEGTVEDISARKQSEAELEKVHSELVKTSRQAGMAEVATGVLHNVGNVLNSVNVSANFVADKLRKSKISDLPKIATLLRENAADLGRFLTSDPKGKQLPGYIDQLSGHLVTEQETLLKKMDLLREYLDHVKEIVAMQQSYAKVSGVSEAIPVTQLVEDAVRLNSGALSRHQVEVLRQYEAAPTINVDRHKVLQILVNLIGNAKYACTDSGRPDRKLTLRVCKSGSGAAVPAASLGVSPPVENKPAFIEGGRDARDGSRDGCPTTDRIQIAVSDNGVGIPPENLIRIFNHGFTTRKDGHGFGLHSGALAAREMGGSLKVESAGAGQGATFILELPLQPLKAA